MSEKVTKPQDEENGIDISTAEMYAVPRGRGELEVEYLRHRIPILKQLNQFESWMDKKFGVETTGADRILENERQPPNILNVRKASLTLLSSIFLRILIFRFLPPLDDICLVFPGYKPQWCNHGHCRSDSRPVCERLRRHYHIRDNSGGVHPVIHSYFMPPNWSATDSSGKILFWHLGSKVLRVLERGNQCGLWHDYKSAPFPRILFDFADLLCTTAL